ncbi:MAG: Holliday junction resolvase RuvX [Candidatus Kapaibacterium sp.]|jgi:putative Holliday junction resolvase
MQDKSVIELCKGKRIAAFDYGLRRVGWAVCDELHIVTTTKGIFERTSAGFWDNVLDGLKRERIAVCIVGIPLRHDDEPSAMIKACTEFAHELQTKSGSTVIPVDEAFSSKRAMQTMISIGVPKSKRRDKSRTDEISAALILQDFLRELE